MGAWRTALVWTAIDEPEHLRRIAKHTTIDEIKTAGARAICGLTPRRAIQGFEPSKTRPPGAAFKTARDAPAIYDLTGRLPGIGNSPTTSAIVGRIGGASRRLVPNGATQAPASSKIRNEAPAIAVDLPNRPGRQPRRMRLSPIEYQIDIVDW